MMARFGEWLHRAIPICGRAAFPLLTRVGLMAVLVMTASAYAVNEDVGGGLLRSYATPNGVPVNEGVLDLKPWLVAPGQQQLPGLAAYEIMAFMAKANARPIGTNAVDFFVRNNGTNIDIQSLGLGEPYVREWSGHSFQFHFDAATTSPFWKRVVDETGMDTVRTPRARQLASHVDHKALPCELVHDRQHSERAAVRRPIHDEVVARDVVAVRPQAAVLP